MSHERFHVTIGLRYTDLKVIKTVVDAIKLMLLEHPKVDQGLKTSVFFTKFGSTSLDIEISAYISSLAGIEFSAIKQELLLTIADIISVHGAEIATPVHSIEIQGGFPIKPGELALSST